MPVLKWADPEPVSECSPASSADKEGNTEQVPIPKGSLELALELGYFSFSLDSNLIACYICDKQNPAYHD